MTSLKYFLIVFVVYLVHSYTYTTDLKHVAFLSVK